MRRPHDRQADEEQGAFEWLPVDFRPMSRNLGTEGGTRLRRTLTLSQEVESRATRTIGEHCSIEATPQSTDRKLHVSSTSKDAATGPLLGTT